MIKDFSDLSLEAQIIIKERFARYGIDGVEVFNNSNIFSNELKSLSSDDIIRFLDHKDISHIYPKSVYPELEGNINNVFFEDSLINRQRGAEIVTPSELENAWVDQISDTLDLDVNEDGILDLTGLDENLSNYFDGLDLDLDLSALFESLF